MVADIDGERGGKPARSAHGGAGPLRQLDNNSIRLDGQGPALPRFEPWGGDHKGMQRPRTSGAY